MNVRLRMYKYCYSNEGAIYAKVYGVKKSKLTHKAHSHQMTKRKSKEEG